jgi:hypothetical protein
VNVGDELRLRLRSEFGEGPEHGIVDRAIDVEPPTLAGNFRHQAEIENRPVPGQMLARRQALLGGARDLAGKEFALARPALLGARQLAVGRRIVLFSHVTCRYGLRMILSENRCPLFRIMRSHRRRQVPASRIVAGEAGRGEPCQFALPNSTGSWRGPRTVPSDQVTLPAGSRRKSGMRFSHSSIATIISIRARLEPTQR